MTDRDRLDLALVMEAIASLDATTVRMSNRLMDRAKAIREEVERAGMKEKGDA